MPVLTADLPSLEITPTTEKGRSGKDGLPFRLSKN